MKICFSYLFSTFLLLFITVNCSSSQQDTEQEIVQDITDDNPTPEEEEKDDETDDQASFTTVVEEYGQLSVEGNKMVDQNGNPAQLRGMSFFWSQWIGKYYTNETVQWLKDDWHCTAVRAALAVDYEGYLVNPEAEKQKIMTVVDAAIEHGLYVIIDWHDHEAENHLEESVAFFGEMAEKYGSYPNIIYEPYNEPLAVSWRNVLKPYHEAVIAEIRKHDPDNLIICGTPNWSQDVEDVIVAKIDDPNVMYTLHYYAATHKQELRDKAVVAINNNIPIFVTEYGVTQASGDESIDAPESETWWNFLDEHKISYLNWSIADKEELSAALKPGASTTGGWSEEDLTISGTMVRDEIRKKNKAY
ncbi:glycoside hydrolase family 5 protein [Muricauda sp. CAU 1633]|uniref:glycoside hydrolase family 5 protein n=1 Tax=Allomuricauda sp. CAU 1633 TaxID=2816036 RepID=UPI001A8F6B3D|nr:glycoside hydrolase family 5 protein [Muricauda sp. CAU 1633]MBO0321055.1 glycoside hydrolase family 5 protein [Muricauda sp. CAU 1633]